MKVELDNLVPLAYLIAIVAILYYMKKMIDEGRDSLDLLGDDPFGAAGPSEYDMGWEAWFHYLTQGGKVDEYEDMGGDIPWYLEYSPAFTVYRWFD